ncbi:hypothetical protein ANN_15913 [Periplaneta americana]|uniref:Uncharacterized protein n=1 Tax=Periplaneta americana TaxID=6978 RepID=A0ABQ8SHH7_PERAM|nr:hypothetical protein ANN_15913 [Periplaneta americana]
MEYVKWTDRIRNETVLERVGEELVGSLADKKLPIEGYTGRNGSIPCAPPPPSPGNKSEQARRCHFYQPSSGPLVTCPPGVTWNRWDNLHSRGVNVLHSRGRYYARYNGRNHTVLSQGNVEARTRAACRLSPRDQSICLAFGRSGIPGLRYGSEVERRHAALVLASTFP